MRQLAKGKLSSAQRQLRVLQGEVAHLAEPGRFAQDLEELQVQLAELDVAYEELEQQNDELQATRQALERERYRYRHLFNEAPFGYLVTDVHGIVEEANHTAAIQIGVHQDLLAGKPLFIYLRDPALLRDLIPRACAGETLGEIEVSIKPRNREPFAAMLTVVRDLDDRDRAVRLRWSVLRPGRRRRP